MEQQQQQLQHQSTKFIFLHYLVINSNLVFLSENSLTISSFSKVPSVGYLEFN